MVFETHKQRVVFDSQNTFLHGFDQEPDAKSIIDMMQVRGYEYIRAARSAEEKLNRTERGLAKVEPFYASGAPLCEMWTQNTENLKSL